jgi:hypothetical protein
VPSLSDFSRRITLRGRKVAEGADALTRKVALAADQAVVSGTPVDTGRARSNWIAAIGGPASSVIDAYVPGESGSTEAANTQAALNQAETVISGYTAGEEIHITNNLPYIQRLNDGYSAQAPANFVEHAVMEAVQVVQFGRIVDGDPGS